jgi:hypothetical protein
MAEAHYQHAEALMQQHVVGWTPARGQGTRGVDIIFAGTPRVAVRVRSFDNAVRYHGQFTVRTKPDERLRLTDVRYYLYGWAQPGWRHHEAPELQAWAIVDWPAFRAALREGLLPLEEHDNGDGTTFAAYGFADEYTLGCRLYVPASPSPSDGGSDAFRHLPWGSCWMCGDLIWRSDDGQMVALGDEARRQHLLPCYSMEVPV